MSTEPALRRPLRDPESFHEGSSVRRGSPSDGGRPQSDDDQPPSRFPPRLLLLGAALALLLGLGIALGCYAYFTRGLPTVESLRNFQPPQTTRVVDRHGVLLGELFDERRTVVPMTQISRFVVWSMLAAEDADFYRHEGLDYVGIARALWRSALAGRAVQGGSTITQQLVKILLLTPERTVSRKIRQLILARRLEQNLSKEQILHLYLNVINFGHGRYGIEEAARFYFGKSAAQLDLAEASLLAGIPQSPSRLSPRLHAEAARRRQLYVLDQLQRKRALRWSELSDREIDRARQEPWHIAPWPSANELAPELLQLARQELSEQLPAEALRRGGLVVHTSLDAGLQRAARTALRHGIDALTARHLPRRARRSKRQTVADPAADTAATTPRAEGAALLLDPHSRDVLAMVGGYAAQAGFNRAVQALRQPGSAFKPIVYALALRSRRLTPASLVIDAPAVYDQWRPQNAESWQHLGPVRLRVALAQSINMVAIRVAEQLGPPAIVDLARQLGIQTPLEPSLALALGASEVRLLELVNAYATFITGRWQPPRIVQRIESSGGAIVSLPAPASPREVLTPAEAYVLTDMLRSVVREGTGAAAQALGRPVAGKTGTSNQARDAWFVGYTPTLVGGVWIGHDNQKPLGKSESGGRTALPVWIEMIGAATRERPVDDFAMPMGVVTVRIDPATGLLAYPEMPQAIDEVFLEGTVPTQQALPADAVDATTFWMEQVGNDGTTADDPSAPQPPDGGVAK